MQALKIEERKRQKNALKENGLKDQRMMENEETWHENAEMRVLKMK